MVACKSGAIGGLFFRCNIHIFSIYPYSFLQMDTLSLFSALGIGMGLTGAGFF